MKYVRCIQIILMPFAILIFCLSIAGCGNKKEAPKTRPPVPVITAQVELHDVPLQLKAIGNVEAFNNVSIKPLVGGTVLQVHFREGQDVRKGQLLFTIDPQPYQAALRQAEAILNKDRSNARNAEEQARRYATLFKEGIVTQEQYDQLKSSADSFAASVAADQAAVDNAKLMLTYCYIKSPIEGKTGNLVVDAGNVVKANETALVTINQIMPVNVSFTAPEREFPTLKRHIAAGDLKAIAIIPSDSSQEEVGTITFIDNNVDLATGAIRLKGTFANKQRLLWPGQFVNITITLAIMRNALVVPATAVQIGQQGQFVFVVTADSIVELRPVVPGINYGDLIVIEKGLKPGETVVTDGQMRLGPGAKVEQRKSGQGGRDAAPAKTGAAGQSPAGK